MDSFSRHPGHKAGKLAILNFNEAQDDGGGNGIWWTMCKITPTLLQIDNHTRTSSLNFLQAICQASSVKALKTKIKTQTNNSCDKNKTD